MIVLVKQLELHTLVSPQLGFSTPVERLLVFNYFPAPLEKTREDFLVCLMSGISFILAGCYFTWG